MADVSTLAQEVDRASTLVTQHWDDLRALERSRYRFEGYDGEAEFAKRERKLRNAIDVAARSHERALAALNAEQARINAERAERAFASQRIERVIRVVRSQLDARGRHVTQPLAAGTYARTLILDAHVAWVADVVVHVVDATGKEHPLLVLTDNRAAMPLHKLERRLLAEGDRIAFTFRQSLALAAELREALILVARDGDA